MASNECCSHWCHNCNTPVWPHGPDSLCPYCDDGFVEEVTSQFAETHSASWFDTAHNHLAHYGRWLFYGHAPEDHRVDPRIHPGPIPAPFDAYAQRPIEVLHPHHDHQQHDVEDEVLEAILRLSVDDEQPGPPPATGSAIRALPTVIVSAQHLNSAGQCPVCQERFELGKKAKQTPCDHIFHNDCIVPWLRQHNTCPVCRFQLPTADSRSSSSSSSSSSSRSRSRSRTRGNSARNHGSQNPLFSLWPRRRSYQ